VGEKAGSKLKKAQDIGTIEILDEQQFLDLLKNSKIIKIFNIINH
jgi:DNA ligase (NAD+)